MAGAILEAVNGWYWYVETELKSLTTENRQLLLSIAEAYHDNCKKENCVAPLTE